MQVEMPNVHRGHSYLSFKDMPVWQEAMGVAERVFTLTDGMTGDR